MNILILDDQEVRHQAFAKVYHEHNVVSVRYFWEFVEQLKANWDLIHLDHDLGDNTGDRFDTYVDGWGHIREYNGMHAAIRCAQKDWEKKPTIIVHSVNSYGANSMVKFLLNHEFDVKWEPFREIEV